MPFAPRAPAPSSLRVVVIILLALLLSSANSRARAQAPAPASDERARGIALYNQGNHQDAIRELRAATNRRADDADAWLYLGLAYNRAGEGRNARRAFERAVRARPDFALARTALAYSWLLANELRNAEREAERALSLNPRDAEARYIIGVVRFRQGTFAAALEEANAALASKPDYAPALLLKSYIALRMLAESVPRHPNAPPPSAERSAGNAALYRQAAASLEQYLALIPNASDTAMLREQLENIRFYAGMRAAADDQPPVLSSSEVTTRAVVISKPEPAYTALARNVGVSGTVILRAVLSGNGQVERILVLQPLSHGLTEAAVQAARRIRFRPAIKDGQQVSTPVTIIYNFNIG